MKVVLDGATFSSLMFCNTGSSKNQYGFLFGDRVDEIKIGVSDSQMHNEDVKSYINISAFVPWPSQSKVYNRACELNHDLMTELAGDQNVVGWYSTRHHSNLQPSFKETAIHLSLTASLIYKGKSEDLCFLLCSSSAALPFTTFTQNQVFFQMNERVFSRIPMTLMNLGETAKKEYKHSCNVNLLHTKSVQEIFKKKRNGFMTGSGEVDYIVKVEKLAVAINSSLQNAEKNLCEKEKRISLLSDEVKDLKTELDQLEKEEIAFTFKDARAKRKLAKQEGIKKSQEHAARVAEQDLISLTEEFGVTQMLAAPLPHASVRTMECAPVPASSSPSLLDDDPPLIASVDGHCIAGSKNNIAANAEKSDLNKDSLFSPANVEMSQSDVVNAGIRGKSSERKEINDSQRQSVIRSENLVLSDDDRDLNSSDDHIDEEVNETVPSASPIF